MGAYFSEIFLGLKSLFIGLGITFKEFFKPVVTVAYPYQTIKMSERYRGHIELIEDEEGNPKCVVCGMCERGCPSGCISLASESVEYEVEVKGEMKTKKKKVLTKYDLNFTTCSLCGQCVESCNFGAIKFSKEYNLASSRKEDFHFDLLNRLKERNS
ncbi:NADH:ubiquinone oxidoreductase chain I-like protein [Desulfocapsa sulfexigens DSM 10523]|uniref:NADH:ubiquinone oxidoreductase chain I-like protein n=1 Tax=Desulfocapsa sulfexigens (strain DSM 10523 / SB164P1) TaxID=1167006 RepID=M1P9F2_DESSD|nr:NADH-quinone oxidoreductase subunit I [Desulfocapsa sulfexigens]AGF80078.1 NADH:ubiquinone oxidoreductase chain I-like protein [Desulfocapsa sulfexigens DSM 10523]